jgi:predicted transcriptional regulator
MALTARDIMDAGPVTVEHRRLVGVVTRVDVLEALTRDQQ